MYNLQYKLRYEVFLLFTVSMVMNMKKKFREEESVEILKILGSINNIEEYQKIHNNEWIK